MEKIVLLSLIVAISQVAFAGGHTRSAVATSATALPPINVPDSRTMRILNFVIAPGGNTALAEVKVKKDTLEVVVLRASDVAVKDSAELKTVQINGPATVTVSNNDATHNAFITYRIVPE